MRPILLSISLLINFFYGEGDGRGKGEVPKFHLNTTKSTNGMIPSSFTLLASRPWASKGSCSIRSSDTKVSNAAVAFLDT